MHLVPLLAEADHDAGFGEDLRVELLHALQQPHRMEVARAGTHRDVKRGHGFEVVVEDVGLGGHDLFKRALLAQEIRRQDFNGRAGAGRADGADHIGEMLRAAVGRDRRGRPR